MIKYKSTLSSGLVVETLAPNMIAALTHVEEFFCTYVVKCEMADAIKEKKEQDMTDIKWHHRDDTDFEDLLFRYYNHVILAETDIAFRISNSSFFENGKLIDVEETLIRFAFID